MAGGDEKSMVDRLNGVPDNRQDNLEKSRLFNRTADIHDRAEAILLLRLYYKAGRWNLLKRMATSHTH